MLKLLMALNILTLYKGHKKHVYLFWSSHLIRLLRIALTAKNIKKLRNLHEMQRKEHCQLLKEYKTE